VAPNQATNAEEQTLAGGGCLTGRICRPSTNPNSATQTDTGEPRLGVRSRSLSEQGHTPIAADPVAAGRTSQHRAPPAILRSVGFIFDFVFGLLGTIVGDAWLDRWRGRRSAEFNCNLRVIAGSQAGFRDGWHDGQVSVHPGRLEFEVLFRHGDGLRGLVTLKRRPPISLLVGAVVTVKQRKPNGGETWKVNADSQIVELTTDTATLEWAVPANKLKWALDRVRSAEVTSA